MTAVARTAAQRDRRQRILTAALDLLGDREYERVQIRDVAERADVALGTLYRYFPSKERLFAHALLDWSEQFETAVRRSRRSSDPERLALALHRAARALERQPHFFRLLAALESTDDPGVTEPFRAYRRRFESVLLESMQDVEPADALAVAAMLSAHLGALLRAWANGERSMRSVHDELDRAVRLLFDGPARPAEHPPPG